MSKSLLVAVLIIVVIAVIGIAASVSTQNSVPTPQVETQMTPASSPAAAAASVSIANFSFAPNTLTVQRGTTVTWTNNDDAAHTVTGDNVGPASQALNKGQTYSYTFNTSGTFPYHCSIHPMMTGTIVVN